MNSKSRRLSFPFIYRAIRTTHFTKSAKSLLGLYVKHCVEAPIFYKLFAILMLSPGAEFNKTLMIMDPTNINTLFKRLENHKACYRVIPFKDRGVGNRQGSMV